MLHRVIGASGSGKTNYIYTALGEALKKNKNCFLIVPEQTSVDCERAVLKRFGDKSNLNCEVLNFERLPNRVAREYGGFFGETADKGGECALLSVIAERNKNELKEYSSAAEDTDFAELLFSLINKLKTSLITPDDVRKAAGSFREDTSLNNKLNDIALIYSEYENFFSADIKDPRDALTNLAAELPYKPFFKGSYIFIDGYYTFTEQEYAVIEKLISSAAEVYISFNISDERAFFEENRKSAERVKSLAHGVSDDYYTGEYKRTNDVFLKKIEKELFRADPPKNEESCDNIKIISARNRFDEVEAAASEILSFVREGNRFKDIAVLCGNTDKYGGIISSVFDRAGIKCYISAKEDIAAKPLFAFMLASVSVITDNFSLTSMKRYIKSGFAGLTVAESDAIINYAASWKLRGKAWYGDEDWLYDPEGYREGDLTKRGASILKTVNNARKKLVPSLNALREDLSVKDLTVAAAVKALYKHMESMSAADRLHKSAERLLAKGEYELSEREIQLWNTLISILDNLYKYCGDSKITPKRLLKLLNLMCAQNSVNSIPAFADSVTFGDASLLRVGGKKMVIILGTIDGEFPKLASPNAFFNDIEAVALEEAGLSISDTYEKQLNTNRFFAYAALSSATERLVVCRPVAELSGETVADSSVIFSLKKIFKPKEYVFLPEDLLYSKKSVAALFSKLEDGKLKDDIKNALVASKEPFYENGFKTTDPDSKIDYKGKKISMSPSKIENYILCPFSYFGNYILSLKEKKEMDWSAPEMGNYVHKMLEMFLRDRTRSGSFETADKEQTKSLVDGFSEEYIDMYIGRAAMEDKRFKHIFDNMKKTVYLACENICAEFENSSFTPKGFEYKIGLTDTPDIPAVEHIADGKIISMRGSIDRVDTCVVNGKEYVRVIDYKTYRKNLSQEALEQGLDAQMFHYLFAYCEKNGAEPAGVIYHVIKMPEIDADKYNTPEKYNSEIEKNFARDGILLYDMDVINSMNEKTAFLPIKITKSGELEKRSAAKVLTSDEFKDLKNKISENVISVGKNIFGGNMDIAPNDVGGKKDPCKYCKLSSLCRAKQEKELFDDSTETEEA